MPGLNQLKKFNSDMLSLGNEVSVRASRGEKPVKVEIPSTIPDIDDSEEFVIGMPVNEAEEEAAPVEEDFSDITGEGAPSADSDSSGDSAEPAASNAPDMSDLLNMGMGAGADDGAGGDEGMPDLSMFEDEPEAEPEPEPEPEISIADMGLDALLAGAGFDEPEPEVETEPEPEPDINIADFPELAELEASADSTDSTDTTDISDIEELGDLDELTGVKPVPGADGLDFPNDISDLSFDDTSDLPSLDDGAEANPADEVVIPEEDAVPDLSDVTEPDDLPELGDLGDTSGLEGDLGDIPSEAPAGTPLEENDLIGLSEVGREDKAESQPAKESELEVSDLEELNLDDIPDMGMDLEKSVAAAGNKAKQKPEYDYDEFDISAGFDDDEETNMHPDQPAQNKKPEADASDDATDLADQLDITDESAAPEVPKTNPADINIEDLSLDALDIDGFDMPDMTEPAAEVEEAAPAESESEAEAEGETDLADDAAEAIDVPFTVEGEAASEELPAETEATPEAAPETDAEAPAFSDDIFNLDDMDAPVMETSPEQEAAAAPEEGLSLEDTPSEEASPAADLDLSFDDAPAPEGEGEAASEELPAETEATPEAAPETDAEASAFSDDIFNLDDMDAPLPDDFSSDAPAVDEASSEEFSAEEVPAEKSPAEEAPADEVSSEEAPAEDFSSAIPDLGDLGDLGDSDALAGDADDLSAGPSMDDFNVEGIADDEAETPSEAAEAVPSDELPSETFNLDDMDGFGSGAPDFTDTVSEESGDYSDLDNTEGLDDMNSGEPLETFDTTGMDDIDFGISDTDSQLDSGSDDLGFDTDFEITGFTDVDAAETEEAPASKKAKAQKPSAPAHEELDTPDFSDALPGEKLPPNTLSDEQYKTFLKNFSEYPLNVRLAFENFIVQDEFTDDAEFEVIEKILNKAPARQVAAMLEKMMDISIPVPRDFEHRSAEEYEAYKKSLSYQLRNRIIPGFIVGCALLLVGIGLFNFGKNCIWKPLMASKLYKQGYALLQAEEYPQSEIKFDEAVSYRLNRKWFFNYARGYREHKQFQRAEKMYQNILMCFRHDKEAGLEYADMELEDMVNYEKAEEIVRREVLDYHINDPDGILKLGDVYLEWGTEKDPAKLELAREQYASLIQLYKPNNLYMSRMMRYFIRSDKLRQVLEVKQNFDGNPKSLSAEDWTELSGYLLDKYYGPLPASQEYLRFQIDGLRKLLLTAAHANPDNPIALYNLSRYYIESQESEHIEKTLQNTLKKFDAAPSLKRRDIYKYIDSYRLLGEFYESNDEHVQAQEQFADGISLYTKERDNAGFEGNQQIGKLYEDMADLKYFVSADYDDALKNYMSSVELNNDSPKIRYRIGFIQYNNDNLTEALGSFMKASDGNVKEPNLMLAMANTLSLRGDDYAAEGYYNQLVAYLDNEVADRGMVFPQVNDSDNDIVNTYLYAANNYGVTLHRLAKRTGNSGLNAKSIVQFQQSLRAWDALTRNQTSMLRLGGTNLAEQNIRYVTHNFAEYEPAIYTEIPKTLTDKERK